MASGDAQPIGFVVSVPGAEVAPFSSKAVAANLEKWDLTRSSVAFRLRYDRAFNKYDPAGFLSQLLASSALREAWEATAASRRAAVGEVAVAPPQAPAAAGSGERIGEVEFDECAVKAVHLGFFDPLEEAGYINGSTGRIAKRIEDYVDGFAVGDMLREALIGEGEEAYDLFDAEARAEFLFRLVGHLALGGPLNQYEDSWSPYAATAKALYKGMLRVRRAKDGSGAPEVVSRVFSVRGLKTEGGGRESVPAGKAHRQSFCYVIVDEQNKTALVWAHAFNAVW